MLLVFFAGVDFDVCFAPADFDFALAVFAVVCFTLVDFDFAPVDFTLEDFVVLVLTDFVDFDAIATTGVISSFDTDSSTTGVEVLAGRDVFAVLVFELVALLDVLDFFVLFVVVDFDLLVLDFFALLVFTGSEMLTSALTSFAESRKLELSFCSSD